MTSYVDLLAAHDLLQAENARLASEVARLREEGALQRAINRAAEHLPYPYTINVSVECGAGWVSVDAGDEAWQVEPNDRTMAQQVEDEIDAALAKP